jgi:hypothetical protein
MSEVLSPDVLKARLRVVLAFADGGDMASATATWLSIEPEADEAMGARLVEAVAQVIGDDRLLSLILFASSAFRLEITEAVDGCL